MGKNYLIDTNILIYYINGEFIEKIYSVINKSFNTSIITKIELLGWNKHTEQGYLQTRGLLEKARIFTLSDEIAEKSIELKRTYPIKLGDSIIAATCLINDFILITRNKKDFINLPELEVINPIE